MGKEIKPLEKKWALAMKLSDERKVFIIEVVKTSLQNLKEELKSNFNNFKEKIRVYGIADVDIPDEIDSLEVKQDKAFEKHIGKIK